MAVVRPFRAIRPKNELAQSVLALPYDVMSREEAAKMAEGNPNSFLHISRAEIDLPEEEDVYSDAVYEKAKENLNAFLQKGTLIEEDVPTIYIYQEVMDGNVQTGVVACVSVDDYENDIIKKHELTRVEKEEDRIRQFYTCSADTEPVFLAHRDNMKLKLLIEGYIGGKNPEYDVCAEDGIIHRLWVVWDQAVTMSICDVFSTIPELYIADGHHRSASAYKVGQKKRAEHPDYDGSEEFNYFMAAIFPESDLHCFDYNRVVKDLNGLSKEDFISKVKEAGFILGTGSKEEIRPSKKHEFTMYLDGMWYTLSATDKIVPQDIIGSLDVSILQENLLSPILGIKDPRTDNRIDFIGGIRGLSELKKRADSDMKVAFAVYPVVMDDLFSVADGGMVMPPKSTWFEPKLGSGLFIHRI